MLNCRSNLYELKFNEAHCCIVSVKLPRFPSAICSDSCRSLPLDDFSSRCFQLNCTAYIGIQRILWPRMSATLNQLLACDCHCHWQRFFVSISSFWWLEDREFEQPGDEEQICYVLSILPRSERNGMVDTLYSCPSLLDTQDLKLATAAFHGITSATEHCLLEYRRAYSMGWA